MCECFDLFLCLTLRSCACELTGRSFFWPHSTEASQTRRDVEEKV